MKKTTRQSHTFTLAAAISCCLLASNSHATQIPAAEASWTSGEFYLTSNYNFGAYSSTQSPLEMNTETFWGSSTRPGDVSILAATQPLPSLTLNASSQPFDAVASMGGGAYSTWVDAYLNYAFRVSGPDTQELIPINISGQYSLSLGGSFGNASVALLALASNTSNIDLLPLFGVPPLDASFTYPNYLRPGNNIAWQMIPGNSGYEFAQSCNLPSACNLADSFQGAIYSQVNNTNIIEMAIHASLYTPEWNASQNFLSPHLLGINTSTTAYIDPFIYIEPTWALTHPGYSIEVSSGIGNPGQASGTVPEPSTLSLMALVFAGMGTLRHRKSIKTN